MRSAPVDKKKCIGCSACAAVCPIEAITMERNEDGFYYPIVSDTCIGCGKCEKSCPVLTPEIVNNAMRPRAYAVKHKDAGVLKKSASGGVFFGLAETILRMGGCVYGAVWTEDWRVEIVRARTMEAVRRMQGSKYVYSHAKESYASVQRDLNQGMSVLFSGMPCQIAALKRTLVKDYPNLFTVEIVCHGAGSEAVFQDYVQAAQERRTVDIVNIDQSSKLRKWTRLIRRWTAIYWADGSIESNGYLQDSYMYYYMKNLLFTEGCYNCRFASLPRKADITLGDFMGIGAIRKHRIPLKDGVSMVWINTEKGKQLFHKAEYELIYEAADIEESLAFNYCLWKPSECPANREAFWKQYHSLPYKELEKTYCTGIGNQMIDWIKRGIIWVFGDLLISKVMLACNKKRGKLKDMPSNELNCRKMNTTDL